MWYAATKGIDCGAMHYRVSTKAGCQDEDSHHIKHGALDSCISFLIQQHLYNFGMVVFGC